MLFLRVKISSLSVSVRLILGTEGDDPMESDTDTEEDGVVTTDNDDGEDDVDTGGKPVGKKLGGA